MRGWRPPRDPTEPDLPPFDQEFEQLRVAKRWGLVPRQWREQSVDDQAAMMAFEMFCDTREAYRDEFKKKHKDGNATGESEYDKLKRLMSI